MQLVLHLANGGTAAFLSVQDVSVALPGRFVLLILALSKARDDDRAEGLPAIVAGWRSRTILIELIEKRNGWLIADQTLNRYLSDATTLVRGSLGIELFERRSRLGVRIANDLELSIRTL